MFTADPNLIRLFLVRLETFNAADIFNQLRTNRIDSQLFDAVNYCDYCTWCRYKSHPGNAMAN